jgi:LemA protein
MNLLIPAWAVTLIVVAVVVVIVAIALGIVCWAIAVRNGFIRMRNTCEEAFATIDVYLKKRFDLIPNVVETVKGYAKHESQTLENVIAARNKYVDASTTAEKIDADASLSNAIKSINVVAEKYPELKANTNFLDLSNQLKTIEGELSNARRYYNGTVKKFNTEKDIFPKSIIANKMGLEKFPYFELDSAEERKNVSVKF